MNARPASLLPAFALAMAILATAGCTGLPEGAADTGDTVLVSYSATFANGTLARSERTATFVVGSGLSGLGMAFERGVRGHVANEPFRFEVHDDPSLRLGEPVTASRELSSVPQTLSVPRATYEASEGPATVGQELPYGYYTLRVATIDARFVNFTIVVKPLQEDDVGDVVGAYLVSDGDGALIHRSLKPKVGATFTIAPPTQNNPQTPLGLAPGLYRTVGATADEIQYSFFRPSSADLVGKDLRFDVTILRVTPGQHAIEPVCKDPDNGLDCNFAARPAPYVNGDPESVLDLAPTADDSAHHTH